MAIDIHELENQLNKDSNDKIKINTMTPVHGGDICQAYKLESGANTYFLKIHDASMYSMLQCEANNLNAIAATHSIRTPKLFKHGQSNNYSFLLLEYLYFTHNGSHTKLGVMLAKLHQHYAEFFGWHENNWIGNSTQRNDKHTDWISFWRDMRLGHQLRLAKKNHAPSSLLHNCEKLMCDLDPLFANYSPRPSLLHGDLWSGNFAFIQNEIPVIYDPACYFGDHETDLAMTELFGGFKKEFYHAYNEHLSIDTGYEIRKNLYNLYHILNHFNLFKGGYADQAERLCLKLLSEFS